LRLRIKLAGLARVRGFIKPAAAAPWWRAAVG
jgi:hypothetical protein